MKLWISGLALHRLLFEGIICCFSAAPHSGTCRLWSVQQLDIPVLWRVGAADRSRWVGGMGGWYCAWIRFIVLPRRTVRRIQETFVQQTGSSDRAGRTGLVDGAPDPLPASHPFFYISYGLFFWGGKISWNQYSKRKKWPFCAAASFYSNKHNVEHHFLCGIISSCRFSFWIWWKTAFLFQFLLSPQRNSPFSWRVALAAGVKRVLSHHLMFRWRGTRRNRLDALLWCRSSRPLHLFTSLTPPLPSPCSAFMFLCPFSPSLRLQTHKPNPQQRSCRLLGPDIVTFDLWCCLLDESLEKGYFFFKVY